MKSLLTICCVIVLFVSCKNEKNDDAYPVTTSKDSKIATLAGTWELTSFYNYVDNKIAETFKPVNGYRQVKMYTATKVMWSKHVPSDSTEWFGYGSYKVEDNHLKEVLDYGSQMMSKIIQEKKEFIYELDLQHNTFSQIELDEDGNRIYSENYKRIE